MKGTFLKDNIKLVKLDKAVYVDKNGDVIVCKPKEVPKNTMILGFTSDELREGTE